MYSIRQESLFSLEQLLEMSPNEKYSWLFETIDVTPILRVLNKKSNRGAPETLNYRAMVYSLFIRLVERMPFVKDLVNRLRTSEEFRYHCRFTGADEIPSETAYSRLFAKLAGTTVFEQLHDRLVIEAFEEGFIDGSNAAVDATHMEARDASTKSSRKRRKQAETIFVQAELDIPPQSEQTTYESVHEPSKPKKRGRKSKAEREQWLQEQAQLEAEKNAFEKTLDGMESQIEYWRKYQIEELSESYNNQLEVIYMDDNNFDCNPTLETERFILRKITLSDVADVFAYASDKSVSKYTTWENHKTKEDTLSFLNFVIKKYESNQPSDWGIIQKQSNKLIGTCGWVYWNVAHNRSEIGYALSREFWNKGVMTEVVKQIINFGFKEMNLNRIEARCMIENHGSERVMQKVGMKHEGIIREQMLVKGNYVSVNMYSILKKEWELLT